MIGALRAATRVARVAKQTRQFSGKVNIEEEIKVRREVCMLVWPGGTLEHVPAASQCPRHSSHPPSGNEQVEDHHLCRHPRVHRCVLIWN